MALKDWKKVKVNPKSETIFKWEKVKKSTKPGIIDDKTVLVIDKFKYYTNYPKNNNFIYKYQVFVGKEVIMNVIIKDNKIFKTKKEALKYAKEYMRKH